MAKTAPKHFFSQNPSVNQQRTLFDMSKTDTVTINPDIYYPNYKLLVLPGDTVVLDYSNMMRLLDPLQVPMMDNLYCDTHFWFVAFDNVWDYTKNFFGEKKRPSDPDINTLPLINFTSSNLPQVGSVYDYFGVPIVGNDYASSGTTPNAPLLTGSFSINALPLMSYYLIHDDWIRDEQRVDYLLDTPDFTATSFSPSRFDLYKRGKRFDYFTSTLLEPQVGNPVTINVGDMAPVYGDGNALQLMFKSSTSPASDGFVSGNFMSGYVSSGIAGSVYTDNSRSVGGIGNVSLDTVNSNAYLTSTSSLKPYIGVVSKEHLDLVSGGTPTTSGMYADLFNATSVTVEQLRRAFQVQAYQEILARYGNRYTEYLYSMYGVVNPDQLLGRPEYLGGTHQRLSVQPIVQNSASSQNAPLGDLGAIVTGAVSEPVFTRSFTRFGYIIGCINIYADLTYYQGLEKDWQLRDRMDFPVSIFANLTDQPVYKSEIVLTGTSTDNEVFGYQEIYSWAKYAQNSLRGLVRPNAPQSVGYWSLAEQFSSVPVNDDTFIQMNTPIDRITNVNSSVTIQHFIINQKFDVKLTRELPMHSDPMKWFMRA